MKKTIYLVVVTILSIVMCFYCVRLSNMNKALKTQYQQLCDLNESINKELLNYKMDPDKLKQEAYLAFKNEDDEGIKKVVKLLEKYHIETPQCAEAKGYIETLAKIREQRRIAEERKKKAEGKRKEAERIAKEKRKKEEENRRLAAVRRLRKEHDDVSNVTWYYNPYFTHYNNRFMTSLYIGHSENYAWLRLRMSWCGETYLSIDKAYLSYEGNTTLVHFDKYKEHKSDCNLLNNNPWWEWIDISVSEELLEFLKGLTKAKTAKMRFVGTTYTQTRTLSNDEMKAIRDVLLAYDALKSN